MIRTPRADGCGPPDTANYLFDTHIHLTALCPGLSGWAGTRKVKQIWILLYQLGHMEVCTSLQTDNHASTPPLSFYRAMLCIRGTSHGPVSVRPSVRLSVRPSVTSRCSTKTAKRKITQTTPHDTLGTLVFWCQRSPRNSTGVTPYGGAKCRWGGSKSATFDK